MASVHDVAAYILAEVGKSGESVGKMQLQKLVYYAQAWSLVWDERPLFPEPIEAWPKGPVVGDLWERGGGGDAAKLSPNQRATITAVIDFYGHRSGSWLSDLTHRERPWVDARERAIGAERPVIAHDAMRAFFASYRAPTPRHIPESIARGLDFLVDLPEHLVDEVLNGEAVALEGVEQWLETGAGNPWTSVA